MKLQFKMYTIYSQSVSYMTNILVNFFPLLHFRKLHFNKLNKQIEGLCFSKFGCIEMCFSVSHQSAFFNIKLCPLQIPQNLKSPKSCIQFVMDYLILAQHMCFLIGTIGLNASEINPSMTPYLYIHAIPSSVLTLDHVWNKGMASC